MLIGNSTQATGKLRFGVSKPLSHRVCGTKERIRPRSSYGYTNKPIPTLSNIFFSALTVDITEESPVAGKTVSGIRGVFSIWCNWTQVRFNT